MNLYPMLLLLVIFSIQDQKELLVSVKNNDQNICNDGSRKNECGILKNRIKSLGLDSVRSILKRKYVGNGYQINIPENWKVKELDNAQTAFIGPKIGNSHIGFYITQIKKGDKSYLDAAKKTKEQQSGQEGYKVLLEKDISRSGFEAFMRRSYWYAKDIDMVLFVREVFTETKGTVFVLSSSIPNNPHIKELDALLVSIMNSFRFDVT